MREPPLVTGALVVHGERASRERSLEMSDEREVDRRLTSWIPATGVPRIGEAVLTTRRLTFLHLVIDLDEVREARRERTLLHRDRIRIRTADDEYLFNEGWTAWHEALQARIEAHGTRRVEGAPPNI